MRTRIGTAVAVGLVLLDCPAFAEPQAVAMFRGDLAHSGVYEGAAAPISPALKWKFHSGGRIVSSPAVAGGLAYAGSDDGKLYAVDIRSGQAR